MYAVFKTESYEWQVTKLLSSAEHRLMRRIETEQINVNPLVGRPLGTPFFREKRLGTKRVYYLVYEHYNAVLLVGISDKKAQQATIDQIREDLKQYDEVVRAALRQRA